MRSLRVCVVGLGLLFAFSANAAASTGTTLGLTTEPSGASAFSCLEAPYPTLIQSAQDPTTPYFVPAAGGGAITQWQTNASEDTPGAPITFAVVSQSGAGYTVVGADSETIPASLPASGVATFTLATPIAVQAGDTLALYSSSSDAACYFCGGSTLTGDDILAADDPTPPPSAGQVLTPTPPCGGGCTLDVAATLVQSEDAGVTTNAAPSHATVGDQALLSSTVSNDGPGASTDHIHRHGPKRADDQRSCGRAGDVLDERTGRHLHHHRPGARPERACGHRRDAERGRKLRQ